MNLRGLLSVLPLGAALVAPRGAARALRLRPLASQLSPVEFERADDACRVARRIETVLSRRTSRIIVVLERLVDGHNYSAIFRTCENLGIQHVWIIGPPAERFASRRSRERDERLERAARGREADANRLETDAPLQPGSRKARKRARAERAWEVDAALDAEHAAHGRGAARFLSVRDFADVASMREALEDVPDVELWASDLGQGADVLSRDAPWLREKKGKPPPARVAIVFGTESTGVSRELLEAADRRVYLPQHGFADSLNVGVAAALALSEVTAALGAGGDLIAGDWRPEDADPAALREKWARHLSRDEAQLAAIRDALGAGIAVLDDLRRAPEFRKHTGKKHKPHK